MANKDYRELQLSSSLLVFIFIAILVLGIIVFLLGVSVGKKQVQMLSESQSLGVGVAEKVTAEKPIPAEEPKGIIRKELDAHQQAKKEEKKVTHPASEQKIKNLYYIQVGAFNKKNAAEALAEKYKKMGYPTIVLNPFSKDRRPVFRVRIGGFQTKEQAQDTKEKLIRSEGKKSSDYFVVRD